MIKEILMYTVVCNNCGKDVNEGADFCAWNDKGFAQDVAAEAGWIKDGDEHYCPDCVSYDDDDNMVIADLSIQSLQSKEQ